MPPTIPPLAEELMRRRFLALALFASVLGCSDTLGPVQTIDGRWDGIQNGYSMSLVVAQAGEVVTGYADIANIGGFVEGDVSGTFKYPNIELTIQVPNFDPITYKGTMSTTQAVINARLNGAGFVNVEVTLEKR